VEKASTGHNLVQERYGPLTHYQQLPDDPIGYVAAVEHETNTHTHTQCNKRRGEQASCEKPALHTKYAEFGTFWSPLMLEKQLQETGPQLFPQKPQTLKVM
jgi:hypothetical protein